MADKKVYQEWSNRVAQVNEISADKTLALWQKAHMCGGAYAGLELNGLKSKHRRKILSGFGKINGILSLYPIVEFEDYQKIEKSDLHEIIRTIKSLGSSV